MKKRLPLLLSVFTVIVLWQGLSIALKNPLILPSFTETLLRLFELCLKASFWKSVSFSVLRVFASFFLALLFGSLLGILAGLFPFFRDFISFPLSIIRSVPVVSFILLAVFVFKSGLVPVFSAFLMGFPVITAAVASGFDFTEDDKKLFSMARVFGLTKMQKIKFIFLPKLKPFFRSGIVSVFGMNWKVAVAAEVLSVPKNALGGILQNAQVHLETTTLLSATIMLVVLSFVFEKILTFAFEIFTAGLTSLSFKEKRAERSFVKHKQTENEQISSIYIDNLTLVKGTKTLFKDFSFAFEDKKITALLAPSGGGKTSLLNWICEHYKVSFLFQEPRLLQTLSVFENVYLPLFNIMEEKESKAEAVKYLSLAGLSNLLDRKTETLSGGEKQRVAMARAFAFPSSILLLDEAFQSLDEKIKTSLEITLKEMLKEKPRTVILVTHQKDEAFFLADNIIEMDGPPLKVISVLK